MDDFPCAHIQHIRSAPTQMYVENAVSNSLITSTHLNTQQFLHKTERERERQLVC